MTSSQASLVEEWIDQYGYVLRVWREDGRGFLCVRDFSKFDLLRMLLRSLFGATKVMGTRKIGNRVSTGR